MQSSHNNFLIFYYMPYGSVALGTEGVAGRLKNERCCRAALAFHFHFYALVVLLAGGLKCCHLQQAP